MSTSQPPFATPEATPPKQGMGKGTKIALILGVIFGVLVLVCCGGMIGVVGFFGSKFTTDQATVRTISAKVAQLDIPPAFQPKFGTDNFSIPFTGISFTMAVYLDDTGSSLTLATFRGEKINQLSKEQLELQMRQAASSQNAGGQNQQFHAESSEERKITVRGKEVPFTFAKGKQAGSDKPWLQVSTMFPASDGMTMILFSGDAEKYSEEAVTKLLESIQ